MADMTLGFRLSAAEIAFYIAERRRGAVIFSTQALGWALLAFGREHPVDWMGPALLGLGASAMLAGLGWALWPRRWMEIVRLRQAAPLANPWQFVRAYPVLALTPFIAAFVLLGLTLLDLASAAPTLSPNAGRFAVSGAAAIVAIGAMLQLTRLERDSASAPA
jgi:hypothetical protein